MRSTMGKYAEYNKIEDVARDIVKEFESFFGVEIRLDDDVPWNEQIKMARKQVGLTLREAASLLGIGTTNYTRMESGVSSILRNSVPVHDISKGNPKSTKIIMTIDEMANGDLMIHPFKQNYPVHILRASERDMLYEKLITVTSFYQSMDSNIELFFNIPMYIMRKNYDKKDSPSGEKLDLVHLVP